MVLLESFNMNMQIFTLIFVFGVVKIEGSYSPIKFLMMDNTPRLILSDELQLKSNLKLHCLCPKNDIEVDDIAHYCTDTINDNCANDYTPKMVERFGKCGPHAQGDLKYVSYTFKLESDEQNTYHINVFQICVNENGETPEYAFAAYNILPSSISTSSTDSHSQTIPSQHIQEVYERKTSNYKEKIRYTEDTLVPQTLIPSNSIPHRFSKGTTNTIYNLMPQWKSKSTKWDHINLIIEQKAQNNEFTVITGASDKQTDIHNVNFIFDNVFNLSMIPQYWWTIIRNANEKKAIVFVMDNKPDQLSSDHKLCPPIDLEKTIWNDIKENESDEFIYACQLTKELFENLINSKMQSEYTLFEKEIPYIGKRKDLRNLKLLYSR